MRARIDESEDSEESEERGLVSKLVEGGLSLSNYVISACEWNVRCKYHVWMHLTMCRHI